MAEEEEKLLDFCEKRKENIEKKRRNFERILFNNTIGAYSVVDEHGMIYPVQLVDISRDGCLFQIPWNGNAINKFENDKEFTMRMYFTRDSYVPVVVTIRHGTEVLDTDRQRYMQYGCEFDKSMSSFEAMESFIEFLYKFAEHSAIDKGDSKVFFL